MCDELSNLAYHLCSEKNIIVMSSFCWPTMNWYSGLGGSPMLPSGNVDGINANIS